VVIRRFWVFERRQPFLNIGGANSVDFPRPERRHKLVEPRLGHLCVARADFPAHVRLVEGSNAIGNLQRLELLRLFVRKEIVDRITKTDAGATSEGEKLLQLVVDSNVRSQREGHWTILMQFERVAQRKGNPQRVRQIFTEFTASTMVRNCPFRVWPILRASGSPLAGLKPPTPLSGAMKKSRQSFSPPWGRKLKRAWRK
jgi:hypothetical protein